MKATLLILLSVFALLTQGAPVIDKLDDQIARYVDDIFYRYDTNDDSYLDRNEARKFFLDANSGNQHAPDSEYTAWFRIIDANHDGKLSWQEVYDLAESSFEE